MQKGIVRTHADVLRRVQLDDQSFDYCQEDVFTHLYGCSSAGSMTDIFGSLLSGATLCVYDVRQAGLDLMAPWLNLNQVTLLHLNSTLLRKFLDQLPAGAYFPELRLVRPSQQLLANDVRRLWQVLPQSAKVIHQYASTETGPVAGLTIDRQTMLSDEIVPVGRPLPGVEIRLLDDQDRSVSMGDVGEIAIRSPYLASGGSAHVPARRDDGDEDFYRTGDLGRIRPDGLLELVGRTDSLVKIRGFRVSLLAIEAALRRLDLVDEAVVAARPDPNGDRTPVAFVVPATDAQGLAPELRRRLQEQLPPYALPARFVFLDGLPRLSNGKVDYGALPVVDTARRFLDTPFVAPRTPVEADVAAIWTEVLGLDRVGIHDSFLDLGGHSLLAARIVSRVVRQFQVDLPLSLLFESPTVADMALAITQHQAARLDQDTLARLLAELEEAPVVPTIEPGR